MTRAIPKHKRDECLRLRRDHNMRTLDICAAIGIGQNSAYRILKNHPLKDFRVAPGGSEIWTADEDQLLIALYPRVDRAELLAALPNRTWIAIRNRAHKRLKLRRKRPAAQRALKLAHPLFLQLRRLRETQKLTRDVLGAKLGYGKHQIGNWENGLAGPRFVHVWDWADSLGYELVLQPKALAEVIAFPMRAAR